MLNINTKFDTFQILGTEEFSNEQTHAAGKDVNTRKY